MSSNTSKLQIHVPRKKVTFHGTMVMPACADSQQAMLPAPVCGPKDPMEVEVNRLKFSLSNVCANCDHWYIGRDRNVVGVHKEAVCAAPGPCGGLAVLRGYPHYRGPLTNEDLRKTCAVCGKVSNKSVETADGRRIGYCMSDFDIVVKLAEQYKVHGV